MFAQLVKALETSILSFGGCLFIFCEGKKLLCSQKRCWSCLVHMSILVTLNSTSQSVNMLPCLKWECSQQMESLSSLEIPLLCLGGISLVHLVVQAEKHLFHKLSICPSLWLWMTVICPKRGNTYAVSDPSIRHSTGCKYTAHVRFGVEVCFQTEWLTTLLCEFLLLIFVNMSIWCVYVPQRITWLQ